MVTSCMHVYYRECLESLANVATAMAQDETACLECGTVFTGTESCDGLKELEFDDYWLLNDSADKKKKDGKVNMEWVAYDKKLVLSAKPTAVRDQVEQWLEQEPEKKIIIFSQFHMMLALFQLLLGTSTYIIQNANHGAHLSEDEVEVLHRKSHPCSYLGKPMAHSTIVQWEDDP